MLLLIPENIRDIVLSVNLFNWLSILHIPFDEYNDFRHFYLTINIELFIVSKISAEKFNVDIRATYVNSSD